LWYSRASPIPELAPACCKVFGGEVGGTFQVVWLPYASGHKAPAGALPVAASAVEFPVALAGPKDLGVLAGSLVADFLRHTLATVALPVAISHKVSLKPKLCASATLIPKKSKNEPKHGPKNGTSWRSHFWDRMHSLVKEQKKSTFTFTVPFLGPSGGTKNETAKSQNPQQRPTLATNKKSTTGFT